MDSQEDGWVVKQEFSRKLPLDREMAWCGALSREWHFVEAVQWRWHGKQGGTRRTQVWIWKYFIEQTLIPHSLFVFAQKRMPEILSCLVWTRKTHTSLKNRLQRLLRRSTSVHSVLCSNQNPHLIWSVSELGDYYSADMVYCRTASVYPKDVQKRSESQDHGVKAWGFCCSIGRPLAWHVGLLRPDAAPLAEHWPV